IITGYNGSGKTNLLKLLWYTISGNTHALLNELNFTSLTLFTDLYTLKLQKVSHHTCRGTLSSEDGSETFQFEDESSYDEDEIMSDARDQFDSVTRNKGSSIFFPTFRRIEGGFTINPSRPSGLSLFNAAKPKGDLPEAISSISRKLTN